jgi:hypothetical protein
VIVVASNVVLPLLVTRVTINTSRGNDLSHGNKTREATTITCHQLSARVLSCFVAASRLVLPQVACNARDSMRVRCKP